MGGPFQSLGRGMLRSRLNAWVCGTLPAGPGGGQPTMTNLVAAPTEEGGNMILQPITLTVLTATVVMVTADTPIPTGTVSFYAIPPGYWTRMSGATKTLIGTSEIGRAACRERV